MVTAPELDHAARNVLAAYLGATSGEELWCFTDRERAWLARGLTRAAAALGLRTWLLEFTGEEGEVDEARARLARGSAGVIAVAALGPGSLGRPSQALFPTLAPPPGFGGRSAVIRPLIPDHALIPMLATPATAVRATAVPYLLYPGGLRARVTAPGGTDLSCDLRGFRPVSWQALAPREHALLPPAEVYAPVVPGTAHGKIVADVTLGAVVLPGGRVLDPLGLVDTPVTLTVAGGRVTAIAGGDLARRLEACLAVLPPECGLVVELGWGLSHGRPTGNISADESLAGTCHFGLGDNGLYATGGSAPAHLDVVIDSPQLRARQAARPTRRSRAHR